LVLYCFLYLGTVNAFLFLQQPGAGKYQLRLVWLLLFFVVSWVEHLYWFNYMRVPLLLAGTGFLLLLKKPVNQKNWPVLAIIGSLFLLALCIRPSAALLGFAVVGPATFLYRRTGFFLAEIPPHLLVCIPDLRFFYFSGLKPNSRRKTVPAPGLVKVYCPGLPNL
jgi:hypothetical protein